MHALKRLFQILFVPADKLYPKAPWCPSCGEPHYRAMNKQNWKT